MQEAEYIRQEARQQFRSRQGAASEELAQAVSRHSRPCLFAQPWRGGSTQTCWGTVPSTSDLAWLDLDSPVLSHLAGAMWREAASAAFCVHLVCTTALQLEEGEKRLELALHYGIAYPRLFHADQFEKVC